MKETSHYGSCLSDVLVCCRHKASSLAMIPEIVNGVYASRAHENFKILLYCIKWVYLQMLLVHVLVILCLFPLAVCL